MPCKHPSNIQITLGDMQKPLWFPAHVNRRRNNLRMLDHVNKACVELVLLQTRGKQKWVQMHRTHCIFLGSCIKGWERSSDCVLFLDMGQMLLPSLHGCCREKLARDLCNYSIKPSFFIFYQQRVIMYINEGHSGEKMLPIKIIFNFPYNLQN